MRSTEPDPTEPWYKRQPERLEWELAQFEARELPARRRTGMLDGRYAGHLVIETEIPFRGASVRVEVVYPFDYPEECPLLFGSLGLLERHQSATSGNFCWTDDSDREWWTGMDAAQLVTEDLRWLLEDSEQGSAVVRAGEADMPEPVTGHVLYGDGVVVVPDPYFEENLPASEGKMTLVARNDRYLLAHAAGLGSAHKRPRASYFKDASDEDGFWVSLDPTPAAPVFNSDELLDRVDEAAPRCFERLARRLKKRQGQPSAECWLGVTFIEEGPLRGEYRRNWVFARIRLDRSGVRQIEPRVRSQALTVKERQRRTPELVGLESARVLLVGAGSLGSPLCFELAKAGVGHTDLIDPDTFDVNNSVRHVLSPHWAGSQKATLTAMFAEELNPFVTVNGYTFRVGGGSERAARLTALLEPATVVVDTTGANAVARILQRRCIELDKPLVVAGLSAGSYGGEVAVFRPGGACFECLLFAQRDGLVPEPHAAPAGPGVTPIGCSHPAFAGAGFDATELAALTARTVVQVAEASKYPRFDADWAVINFRGEPRSQTGTLQKHPECGRCS